jgi:hypothetical protein
MVFYYGYKAVTPCTRARKGYNRAFRGGWGGTGPSHFFAHDDLAGGLRPRPLWLSIRLFRKKSFLFHHVYIAASRVASGLTRGLVLLSYADGFNIPALQICSIVSIIFDRVVLWRRRCACNGRTDIIGDLVVKGFEAAQFCRPSH